MGGVAGEAVDSSHRKKGAKECWLLMIVSMCPCCNQGNGRGVGCMTSEISSRPKAQQPFPIINYN